MIKNGDARKSISTTLQTVIKYNLDPKNILGPLNNRIDLKHTLILLCFLKIIIEAMISLKILSHKRSSGKLLWYSLFDICRIFLLRIAHSNLCWHQWQMSNQILAREIWKNWASVGEITKSTHIFPRIFGQFNFRHFNFHNVIFSI